MQSQENSINKISNSSQLLIEELINWQASQHPSRAKQAEVRTTNSG